MCEESNQKLGLFHAVRYLRDDGELTYAEIDIADKVVRWFHKNMESPLDYLNKQRSKESDIFISWFKPSAIEHISQTRTLVAMLEDKGVAVETLTTSRPGKIVYEDDYQIFAKPYKRF